MTRTRPLRRLITVAVVTTLTVGGVAVGSVVAGPGAAYAASCSQSYLPLPDPSCQPGAYNSAVTQSTINSTICVSGWTATVRPPSSYTTALKIQQIAEYGYSDTATADYEEDHLVPLELGGSPKAATNLWPEPRYGSKTAANKDTVENKLKRAVCAGTVTISAARSAIRTNWTTALANLGLS
jgi:hypothetical protein